MRVSTLLSAQQYLSLKYSEIRGCVTFKADCPSTKSEYSDMGLDKRRIDDVTCKFRLLVVPNLTFSNC